jgi:hypothetical protein
MGNLADIYRQIKTKKLVADRYNDELLTKRGFLPRILLDLDLFIDWSRVNEDGNETELAIREFSDESVGLYGYDLYYISKKEIVKTKNFEGFKKEIIENYEDHGEILSDLENLAKAIQLAFYKE